MRTFDTRKLFPDGWAYGKGAKSYFVASVYEYGRYRFAARWPVGNGHMTFETMGFGTAWGDAIAEAFARRDLERARTAIGHCLGYGQASESFWTAFNSIAASLPKQERAA